MKDRDSREIEPAAAVPSAVLAEQAYNVDRTERDIFALAWPVMLSALMVNLVNLVDIFMLGQLGTETLAAVGYATQFLFLGQTCLLAVGSACVAMMARAIGAGDLSLARRAFAANLVIGVAVAVFLTTVGVSWPRELLSLLDVPPPVVELATPYFRLTMLASVPLAVALVYEHAFRAAKDTLRPMRIAGLIAAVKLALNMLLIFGWLGFPRLELVGAGVATVISQLVGVVLFVLAARGDETGTRRLSWADIRETPAHAREAIRLAVPAIGERIVMTVAIMLYFRFLGRYGVAAVAAYNVGVRILSFTWIPGMGLAVAASTLVGQSLGAGDPELARRAAWRATLLGLVISIAMAAIFIALRVPMARAFTSDGAVIEALDPFLLMLGLGLPLLVSHFTLGGALRGAGDTVTPLLAAVAGAWLFRVPLGYLFAAVLRLPLSWVWSVMILDHFARCVWIVWVFQAGRWQRIGVTTAPAE